MEKKKILVIDDEKNFGEMVKMNLEDTGRYTVKIETKGIKALDTVKEFRPDLILLDVVMPDIDGGSICHQIKSDEELKDIPIVFLTAIVREEEIAPYNGIIAGHPFIAKPVTVEKLIDCIEKNLKK